jgi:hypothetical protein
VLLLKDHNRIVSVGYQTNIFSVAIIMLFLINIIIDIKHEVVHQEENSNISFSMGCKRKHSILGKSFVIHSTTCSFHRKVKICVATRHAGAKEERTYSSYSFLTTALDGDEWSALRIGHASPLGKDPRYSLDRRLSGPQSWSGHRG